MKKCLKHVAESSTDTNGEGTSSEVAHSSQGWGTGLGGRSAGGRSASCAGRGSSCRCAGRAGGSSGTLGEVGGVEVTAVCLLVRVAKSLSSGVTNVVCDTVCEDQLALECRDGFGIVLKAGCRVVGSAGASVVQGGLGRKN